MSLRGGVRLTRTVTPDAGISYWRYLVVVAGALMLTHAVVHGAAEGVTVKCVLSAAPTSLVPTAGVFLLWPVVAIGVLAYGLFALAPDQRRVAIHDDVARHVVLVALLSSLQLITLVYADVYLQALIALLAAVAAGAAYVRIHDAIVGRTARAGDAVAPATLPNDAGRLRRSSSIERILAQREAAEREAARQAVGMPTPPPDALRPAVGAPFALLAGYTAMIAIGFTDAAITTAGCPSSAPALALVLGVAVLAVRAALLYRDPMLSGFTALALTTMVASHPTAAIASLTLLAAGVCGALAILMAALRITELRRRPVVRSSDAPIHVGMIHRRRM